MFRIEIKPTAQKNLSQIPSHYKEKISIAIDDLTMNPYPIGSKKLKGTDNLYGYRVGKYRIIYEVFKNELVIYIIDIDHRKDVYKNM